MAKPKSSDKCQAEARGHSGARALMLLSDLAPMKGIATHSQPIERQNILCGTFRPAGPILLAAATLAIGAIPHAQARTFNLIYAFNGASDGSRPRITLDPDGHLYGVAQTGGNSASGGFGDGTAFQLTPSGDLTTLHTFAGPPDGRIPLSVAADWLGNVYGAADGGPLRSSATMPAIS